MVFEIAATGGVVPTYSFTTVKLLRYINTEDFVLMAFEFIFCFFVVYYMIEEAIEIKIHKLSYFTSVWNLLDITVLVVSSICTENILNITVLT